MAGSSPALASIVFLLGCGRIGFDSVDSVDGSVGERALLVDFQFEDTLTDGVGNRTATCTSCPTFVLGHTGQGIQFTGTQCVSIADEAGFHSPEFTFALWMKMDAGGGDTVFAKSFDDIATGLNSWELYLPDDNTAQFTTIEANTNIYLDTDQVPGVTWRHYAGTLDATAKRLYVDGVQRASTQGRGTSFDSGRVRIGCDKDDGVEVGTFSGVLDDVRLYDRALSADEIVTLARQ